MPFKEIHFDPNGDRLSVAVEFGDMQLGVYTLRVWESGSNDKVMEESGNNLNPDDDWYDLPLPVPNNDGRVIECISTVVNPDFHSGDRYAVAFVVYQGEQELDFVEEAGEMDASSVTRTLIGVLRAS